MTEPYTLPEIVALLTRRVAELQSTALQSSRFGDLSMSQVVYLQQIEQMENPTPTELAESLALSKPSVSAALEKLSAEGYIRKVRSDADRRSYHVHLSEKGRQAMIAHAQVHDFIAHSLTRGLEEAEIQQLVRLLNKAIQVPG